MTSSAARTVFPVTQVVDGNEQVLSWPQWSEAYARDLARRHPEATLTECRETANAHWQEWRDAVVSAYNDGAHIPTRLLRSMDAGLLYRIARTHRALASNNETRDLSDRIGRPFLTS